MGCGTYGTQLKIPQLSQPLTFKLNLRMTRALNKAFIVSFSIPECPIQAPKNVIFVINYQLPEVQKLSTSMVKTSLEYRTQILVGLQELQESCSNNT
jgi:hypothetical protein